MQLHFHNQALDSSQLPVFNGLEHWVAGGVAVPDVRCYTDSAWVVAGVVKRRRKPETDFQLHVDVSIAAFSMFFRKPGASRHCDPSGNKQGLKQGAFTCCGFEAAGMRRMANWAFLRAQQMLDDDSDTRTNAAITRCGCQFIFLGGGLLFFLY